MYLTPAVNVFHWPLVTGVASTNNGKSDTTKSPPLLFVIIGILYMQFFTKEVDADANKSPIKSEKVNLQKEISMDKELALAAEFAYDKYNDRFFVSTDTPHKLFAKKEAKIFIIEALNHDRSRCVEIESRGMEELPFLQS